MGVVDDVHAFLTAQSLAGGSTGWTLTRRRLMDAPAGDQAVIVAEDGGPAPEEKASEGIGDSALSDPGVLITVRAKAWDGDASLAKAVAILAAVRGKFNQVLVGGGTVYFRVRAQTPEPVFAGYDDQNRPMHTIAFRLLKLT